MALSSDEVNFLVMRYLVESGYHHTSFAFAAESQINKTNINGTDVPPGALIHFLQKGLQYCEIEAGLRLNGSSFPCQSVFSRFQPDAFSKDIEAAAEQHADAVMEAMDLDLGPNDVAEKDLTPLRGHASEVYLCAWSPAGSVLATAAGDSTVCIWQIPSDAPSGSTVAVATTQSPYVLHHTNPKHDRLLDVTALQWSPNGALLVTGAGDGKARIWSDRGELLHTISAHNGPIMAARFSPNGDLVATAGVDGSACVWDKATGDRRYQCAFHSAPLTDLAWRDNALVATSSADRAIHLCKIGETMPVRTFGGHSADVNAVAWDPTGTTLASASDDHTVKLWRLDGPATTLAHKKEVYSLSWGGRSLLATGSFDGSAKIWNAETGQCLFTLSRHTEPVYTVVFSPCGAYLATGAFDARVYVWSVKTGEMLKSFKGPSRVFDVSWNSSSTKLAVCTSSNVVFVFDLQ